MISPKAKEAAMNKRNLNKKLTLNRETVRNLTATQLERVRAGVLAQWSDAPECDPGCTPSTLSCTL